MDRRYDLSRNTGSRFTHDDRTAEQDTATGPSLGPGSAASHPSEALVENMQEYAGLPVVSWLFASNANTSACDTAPFWSDLRCLTG